MNMPILYQNILASLPNELSRRAFLWGTERPGNDRASYKAEAFAREVATKAAAISILIDHAVKIHVDSGNPRLDEAGKIDLLTYVLKRHANYFWGECKSMYSVAAA